MKIGNIHRFLIVFSTLPVMTLLVSCAQTYSTLGDASTPELYWPMKPAKPRIKYIGSFTRPEELGISRGFFSRVADFFTGDEMRHMVRPMAVLAPNKDEIYVADPGVKGVHYYNTKESEYKLIRLVDDGPLPSPVALTAIRENRVVVVDSVLGEVFTIQTDKGVATPLRLNRRLKQPTGIAYNVKKGRMYVTDTATHSVNIFDDKGQFIKSVGKRGRGRKHFNFPTLLWLDRNNQLLVTDSLNFRVQRLSASGKFLGHFGKLGDSSGSLSRPKGVATDRLGHVYVVDSLFHALQVFDKKGRLLINIGQQGQKPGQFWLPTGIYISNNNMVFIADSHNRRIQVFEYIGDRS